jgi:GntR family transcriptional regulator
MVRRAEGTAVLQVSQLRFERVAEELRRELRAGSLSAGDRLPAERDLCRRFAVSRGTVRRALSRLRDLGLIRPAARGWIVCEPSLGEPNALLSFSEMAAEAGAVATSDVLAARTRRVHPDEAAALDMSAAGQIFELTRLRRLSGVPIGIEVTRLPQDIAAGVAGADLANGSLYAHLRAGGVTPARAEYVVQASIVSEWEASLLDIPPGSAALILSAVTYDTRSRAIELSRSLFRADRYRFLATLSTDRSAQGRGSYLLHDEGGSP